MVTRQQVSILEVLCTMQCFVSLTKDSYRKQPMVYAFMSLYLNPSLHHSSIAQTFFKGLSLWLLTFFYTVICSLNKLSEKLTDFFYSYLVRIVQSGGLGQTNERRCIVHMMNEQSFQLQMALFHSPIGFKEPEHNGAGAV